LLLVSLGQWVEFRFFIPPSEAESYVMGRTGEWALYGAMGVHILLYLWLGASIGHLAIALRRRLSRDKTNVRQQANP